MSSLLERAKKLNKEQPSTIPIVTNKVKININLVNSVEVKFKDLDKNLLFNYVMKVDSASDDNLLEVAFLVEENKMELMASSFLVGSVINSEFTLQPLLENYLRSTIALEFKNDFGGVSDEQIARRIEKVLMNVG
jgi:hypothetical protein